MTQHDPDCPFCEIIAGIKPAKEIIESRRYFVLKWDLFPVSKGHVLVIPKRHIASPFELSQEEWCELESAILAAKRAIEREHKPQGYNVGVNVGEAAGQTIHHMHIHVIPRYFGDVQDPIGGIRNVIPGKGKYPVTQ